MQEEQYVPVVSPLGYTIAPPTINNRTGSVDTFSPAEVYWLKADWYYNQWDTAMADAYRAIADGLWNYSSFANQSVDAADALINYIRQNEAGLQSTAGNLYWQLVWDMQTQKDYINQMFWPQWALTQEIDTYYDDLWNYLATDAGRQAATIAAQWIHSGASLWAIRAQQNEAYNESFWRYIKAKEQQINAKQQVATNLINYMSKLRQEYWDTTNQYVIELYKRANDLYNNVAASVANDIRDYNKLRIQWTGSSSSSSTSTTSTLDSQINNLTAQKAELLKNWIPVPQELDNKINELIAERNAIQNWTTTTNANTEKEIVTEYDNPDEKVWMSSNEKHVNDALNTIASAYAWWWLF